MFNYRRIYINSAKFAIGKSIGLNFMVNTRKLYLIVVTAVITCFTSYVLGWFHMNKLSLGLGLVFGLEVLIYQLDNLLKYDNLPFETTVRYFVVYAWQYWFKKKQLFQDKRLNSNSKRYKIL
ncbi:hypothetical protein FE415_04115 [Leuconostoc carnosum]|nr:hypothetical protein FE415_04115 [Leuconostoc carnosum]